MGKLNYNLANSKQSVILIAKLFAKKFGEIIETQTQKTQKSQPKQKQN